MREKCWLMFEAVDEFFMLSFLQSAQSGSGVTDSCEGTQVYPPTPPIMLQVSCRSALQSQLETHMVDVKPAKRFLFLFFPHFPVAIKLYLPLHILCHFTIFHRIFSKLSLLY